MHAVLNYIIEYIHAILRHILLTVVRIHMSAATLAPMATAPAVPPRTALLADLFRTSEKVSSSGGGDFAAAEDMVDFKNMFCFASLCLDRGMDGRME